MLQRPAAETPPTLATSVANLSAASSVELLALARDGRREAIDVLFARHLAPLRRWASGRLPRWARDIADTQDLVQDTLLRTFRRIDLFEPAQSGALERYLRQAVMNRIRDEFRKTRRRDPPATLDSGHATDAPSPLDEAISAELVAEYETALARLPSADRDAIVGRLELDLTYDELAATLGKPNANAARSAVVRAIARLAREMRHA
jgi:RNA polymerase sigma-70 factor (ECF subfamily)